MNVWVVTVGEPLPIDSNHERLLRAGLLSNLLSDLGHNVLWWSSTFDHGQKRHRHDRDTRISVAPGLTLQLLHGLAYPANVSVRRLLNHRQVAKRFAALAPREPPPDVILTSMPTVELAGATVEYARSHSVPVVVDIRDLWPDAITGTVPLALRPAVQLALLPMYRTLHRTLARASALVGVSPSYLNWGLQRARRQAGPLDRVFTHGYPAVDRETGDPGKAAEELQRRGVDPKKKIVWFVGMFGRCYDLSTVIGAARRIQEARQDQVQFVLSGWGPKAARWTAEARGLSNVVFTRWVNQPQLRYLLSVAWVGLVAYAPTAPQSYPNKLFEYLSGGLPVLSSLTTDTAELLARHRCGLTYRAGDSRQLTERLQCLLANPTLHKELADNARAAFTREFSATSVYTSMAQYLLDLARTPGVAANAPSVPDDAEAHT